MDGIFFLVYELLKSEQKKLINGNIFRRPLTFPLPQIVTDKTQSNIMKAFKGKGIIVDTKFLDLQIGREFTDNLDQFMYFTDRD